MAWCQLCWPLLEWSQSFWWIQVLLCIQALVCKINLGELFVKMINDHSCIESNSCITNTNCKTLIRTKFLVKSFLAGYYWQNHYLSHTQRKKTMRERTMKSVVVFTSEMLENLNFQEANRRRLLGRYVRASYSAGLG